MSGSNEKDTNKQFMELRGRYDSLEEEFRSFKAASESQVKSLQNKIDLLIKEKDLLIKEKNLLIKENASLKEENFRFACIINTNSDNSSLPPSTDQKPSKEKKPNEYNGREKKGRQPGAQPGACRLGVHQSQSGGENPIRLFRAPH